MSNGIKGVEVISEGLPTISGGHFLPPADNLYDLGSAAFSWRNLHVQTAIYATSVVGSWSPSADNTYYLGTDALGWKGIHLPDVLIVDESGYAVLRNNANTAYVGLKASELWATDGTYTVKAAVVSNVPTIYGTGAHLRIGDAATTDHSLDSEDDLLVTGDLEVNGEAWMDGVMYCGNTLRHNDDKRINWGTGWDAFAVYSTQDANAFLLHFGLPHVDEAANNVAVLALTDRDTVDTDLGSLGMDFSGITEPTLAVGNEASNAWASFDAGDSAGAGKGVYFKAAADEDINILALSVSGTPTVVWDESEDRLAFSHGINVGGAATGLKFTGTYTSHIIDFSSITQAAGDISLIRAGTYASPMDAAGEAQYGMMRLYLSTDDDGTSYNRGIFVCLKTAGTKGIFPIAGLAEVLAQSGNGPTKVQAAQFIADLHTTDAKLAALGGDSTAGMYGGWFKVTATAGATTASGSRAAPVWLDNQLYGENINAGMEEYAIFSTAGGSVPKAWAGFETTSGGWGQLLYFDETAYDQEPVSSNYLKVMLNTTQYYIPLSTAAGSFVGTLGAVTLSGAVAGGAQAFTNVGDMTFADTKAIKTGTANWDYFDLQAYDVDGGAYRYMLEFVSANNPYITQELANSKYNYFYYDGTVIFEAFGFTGSSPTTFSNYLVQFSYPTVSGISSNLAQVAILGVGMTTADSSSITTIANLSVYEPQIILGDSASLTNAVSLYIGSAPTEGTNNYALWVDTGTCRFDGNIFLADTVELQTGILDNDYFVIKAVDNDDQSLKEVARAGGATGPYFGLGADGAALKATAANLLGFFGATPVAQQTKAAHNDWAAVGDVVNAMVSLGLFDAA